jgi:hypothetical protein
MTADMSQPRQPKIPDMSQPRQPKIPPATTVANSPFQTPLTSIAERPTSWIPGMTADMSQPRQPKIPS